MLLLGPACSGTDESSGTGLPDGDRAPNFMLPSSNGQEISLVDYIEKRPVLLYFSMGPG